MLDEAYVPLDQALGMVSFRAGHATLDVQTIEKSRRIVAHKSAFLVREKRGHRTEDPDPSCHDALQQGERELVLQVSSRFPSDGLVDEQRERLIPQEK